MRGDSASVKDQYFASNVLLVHADGADASTAFTDVAKAKTVTAVGNAQVDTGQSKFGGASAQFDGTGDELSVADSDDWSFGSGSGTVSFWLRTTSLAAQFTAIGQFQDGTHFWAIYVGTGGAINFQEAGGGGVSISSSAGAISTNTWYFISMVKSGNTWTLYKDCTSVATTTDSDTWSNNTAALTIGSLGAASQYLTGHIDDVQITKGVARTCTTPTAAFPDGKWFDTSGNGYDFFTGTATAVGTNDPTYNGTPGTLTSSEYWSFDAGDFFTLAQTNPSWINNLHKDNAAYTFAFWIRSAGSSENWIFGDSQNSASNIGVVVGVNPSVNQSILNVSNGSGTYARQFPINMTVSAGVWQFFCVSIDEAANTGFWYSDGTVYGTGSTSYTSPSASSATHTSQIAAEGNDAIPLPNGARLGIVAAWSRALTSTERANFQALTNRYR